MAFATQGIVNTHRKALGFPAFVSGGLSPQGSIKTVSTPLYDE
jgi:hypothetical protein